ncbi:MAG: T9SS type A sorting domain-containing protein [Chitinophagaceae bacterium]|nr:T9SS type A sorting domain-containing protein [Chitinophagaceae bacterium]
MQPHIKLLLFVYLLMSGSALMAQNINTPNKTGPMGLEVNSLTGNLFFSRNDLYIPARGFDLNITFHYNSFNFDINTGYGKGWSFIYNIRYKNDTANGKIISWGDGREDAYQSTGSGSFKAPAGFFSTLSEYQPNKFSLTETNGDKYFFDNSTHKRITRMQEPNGNFLSFGYTDSLLTSITNAAGQSISFSYDAKGRLASVTDAVASPTRSWTYTYDASDYLTQVTDALGGKYKYTYLINGPVKSVTDMNSNVVDVIYYNDFTVSEMIGCNKRLSFSYDTTQKTTLVTDYLQSGQNQVTTYKYSGNGNSTWLTGLSSNCCGFNMNFEYDAAGNKIKETDANGNITTYTYDGKGNMLTMTDALNQTVTYTYSSDFNKVTSMKDAKGFITTMTYDSKGNLTQLTEPGNLVYTAVYNSTGDITSSTDPKGNTFTYSYDVFGNPLSVSGPEGYTAALGFDARGNLLSFTDARNNSTTMEYDILSRMKKLTDPLNNNVQLSYDAMGNNTIVKNKNNESSFLKFDASNRLTEYTNELGNKIKVLYDGMDNIVSITDEVGNTSSLSYDTRNRLSGMRDAQGNQLDLSYDAKGNIIGLNLPSGQRYNYSYDALDRIKTVTDINGSIAQFEYDKNNNITRYVNGTGAITQLEYDSLNRIKTITDPLGNTLQLSFDKNSNIVLLKDQNGKTSSYTYDNLNRIKTYTDNNGSVTTVTYDAQGNVTALTDANNNSTAYTYDNLNRVLRTTFPDGKFMEYGYDKKSNIISKRLTDGTTILYAYDSLSRIKTKTLPDGQVYSYTYDAANRLLTASNNSGTVTFAYDVLNRVISETSNGRTVKYNYSITGRTQTTVYPDSTVITKTFDTRNRLTGISKNGSSVVSYQYTNANQLVSKTFANGVTSTMQYDFANRLSGISTGNGTIQNMSFAYDKNQNKTAVSRLNTTGKSEQFTYDNGNRLTNYKRGPVGGPFTINNTYTYDALGNRISANLNGTNTNYTTNNLNQLVTSNNGVQTINYTYDANGNLSYDGKYYKTYDAEKRLMKDSASPTNVLTYAYDALGRRILKTINGTALRYTYAGLEPIEERDAGGALKNRTIFTGFLQPVVNEKNGVPFYYHQNELNNVEALTNSNGNAIEKYEYDVYGKQTMYDSAGNIITGSLTGNRFGFTGQVYDSATATNKFFFREYNPETGLFNQRDLIGYGDGMGMYQYVHNNPANGVDVFGLEEDPCAEQNNRIGKREKYWADKLSTLAKIITIVKDEAKKRNIDLSKNEKFKKGSLGLKLFNFLEKSRKVSVEWNDMSDKDLNVAFAELEMSGASIANDMGLLNKYPNLKATISGYGVIDAKVQLVTGKSIPYHYAHLSDGAEEIGTQAAKSIPSFQRRFNRHEELIWHLESRYGKDRNKWRPEWLEIEEIHMTAKRSGMTYTGMKKPDCPQNGNPGGSRDKPRLTPNPVSGEFEVISASDPNEIIGPAGEPNKRWVSVKDRLPYTVTYENEKAATAPAKYVKVFVPVHNKMDASSFELKNLGFNSLTFTVPPATASSYQRLDCRDSLGLFVDMTAGYDVVKNQFFWEFQSIDPVTLLPPADPLKGFLLRQDSANSLYGHGFVNFSIKPVPNAQTLDSILAQASIIFDTNDTIPTNIEKNTIDALAPTSNLNNLGANYTGQVPLSWSGADDVNGCGVRSYTLYVSTDGINFNIVRSGITRTDTTFTGNPNTRYYFFVLATDTVGNTKVLRPGAIKSTLLGTALPLTWLYFNGTTKNKNNVLNWATASEQNTKLFEVQRSFDATTFTTIGTVNAAGNTSGTTTYDYTDYNIDRLNKNIMYYRLKQVDLDNRFTYSNILRLTYNETEALKTIVYPNPTQGMITIVLGDRKLIGTDADVYDEGGRLLQRVKITSASQTFNLSTYLNGVYFIKLQNKEVLKIIKQQ